MHEWLDAFCDCTTGSPRPCRAEAKSLTLMPSQFDTDCAKDPIREAKTHVAAGRGFEKCMFPGCAAETGCAMDDTKGR